ncbi:MAG TPA: phage integrase N-terminal SAM-like domain-containing protein [Vicinamibacterales bacterium]|nr:phage integrase N-terminal SAM-like domain-containing protein [Vicinamibacterales bacterium]
MKRRGVFERKPGSGVWHIRYADASGRIRRERAGRKSTAIALLHKRKTEVLEGKKLPERLRSRRATLTELGADALTHSELRKRTSKEDITRLARVLSWFGKDRLAESLTSTEIEQALDAAAKRNGWASSTVNHHRSFLSLMFRLAIANGKVSSNPVRATRHRKEDNSRVRHLSESEEHRLRSVIEARWSQHLPEFDLALHTGLLLTPLGN